MSYSITDLCSSCEEPLCTPCGGCHNENCELYTNKNYCPECDEEICSACGICHSCESDIHKTDSLGEHTIPLKKWNEDITDLLGDSWFEKTLNGIKAVKPIMAIYAVPSKEDHNAVRTAGIVIVKMFPYTVMKSKPVYRIISFPFNYGKSHSGECDIVYPVGFRVSPVFITDESHTEYTVKYMYTYVTTELVSYMYPPYLNGCKWAIRIHVDPADLINDEFCKFVNANVPLIPNYKSDTQFIAVKNHHYDYSEYECQ